MHMHMHMHDMHMHMHIYAHTFSRKSKSAMLRLVILIRWYLAAVVSRVIVSRAIVRIALGGQVMPRYMHMHICIHMVP